MTCMNCGETTTIRTQKYDWLPDIQYMCMNCGYVWTEMKSK